MESILSRIEQLTQNEGTTLTALEKQIGASKAVLTRAFNNNTDISSKWIQRIVENYPLYNIEWLITGKGEMLKSDAYPANKDLSKESVVNNSKENYTKNKSVEKLIDIVQSQQDVIKEQTGIIKELTKKNNGTNTNGTSASSA